MQPYLFRIKRKQITETGAEKASIGSKGAIRLRRGLFDRELQQDMRDHLTNLPRIGGYDVTPNLEPHFPEALSRNRPLTLQDILVDDKSTTPLLLCE